MLGLLKALGVVKSVVAVTALTVIPAVAAAAASNALVAPDAVSTGAPDAAAIEARLAANKARLAANKARLLTTLEGVLTRLQANPKVNAHAIAALKARIAVLTGDTAGLDHASSAVGGAGGSGAAPTLPPQATDHPGPGSHPGQP